MNIDIFLCGGKILQKSPLKGFTITIDQNAHMHH